MTSSWKGLPSGADRDRSRRFRRQTSAARRLGSTAEGKLNEVVPVPKQPSCRVDRSVRAAEPIRREIRVCANRLSIALGNEAIHLPPGAAAHALRGGEIWFS